MLPKPNGNGANHLFALNSLRNNACATALRNVQGMAAVTPERKHALFYATFHHSFAIAVVSAMDRTAFIEKHPDRHRVVLSGAFR
jgi:hypothetical protein